MELFIEKVKMTKFGEPYYIAKVYPKTQKEDFSLYDAYKADAYVKAELV